MIEDLRNSPVDNFFFKVDVSDDAYLKKLEWDHATAAGTGAGMMNPYNYMSASGESVVNTGTMVDAAHGTSHVGITPSSTTSATADRAPNIVEAAAVRAPSSFRGGNLNQMGAKALAKVQQEEQG